jgi:hypothetical protein
VTGSDAMTGLAGTSLYARAYRKVPAVRVTASHASRGGLARSEMVAASAEVLGLEGAGPGRPRKGRRAQRYRPTAKLLRCRLAVELRYSMLPILHHAGPWAR